MVLVIGADTVTVTTGEDVGTMVEMTTVWVVVVVSLGPEAETLKPGGCHLERTLMHTVV